MSEGAVALILERSDIAKSRGVHSLAELAGVSVTNDAGEMAFPAKDGRGLSLAMSQCLADAEQTSLAPDVILSGSSGTDVDDKLEGHAVNALFNTPPPLATSKRNIGVAMGTAIFFDIALAIEILKKKAIPKSMLPFDHSVTNISSIMCNGIGLNGLYGSVLLRTSHG